MAGLELWGPGTGWGIKDSVQGNKQATVATLLSLNLGLYKSQDLRVFLLLGYTVSHAKLATGIYFVPLHACYSYMYTGVPDVQYV